MYLKSVALLHYIIHSCTYCIFFYFSTLTRALFVYDDSHTIEFYYSKPHLKKGLFMLCRIFL